MEIESPRMSTFGNAGSGVKLQFSFLEVSAFEPASGLVSAAGDPVGAAIVDSFNAVLRIRM